MTRALAIAAAAAVLGLAAVACGGSDPAPAPAPATEPPATAAATPRATEAAPATEAPPATATASATPSATEPPAATATMAPGEEGEVPLEIVTLLLPDAIPAIDRPRIISAEEGDAQLSLSDIVIGVSIDGQHRAYGAAFLSAHEIVNDTLGGRPIAVTW